jgi:hypothetical protein
VASPDAFDPEMVQREQDAIWSVMRYWLLWRTNGEIEASTPARMENYIISLTTKLAWQHP